MNLSVKARIGVAMTTVVMLNAITGVMAWDLQRRADVDEAAASAAAVRAGWIGRLSEGVTGFMSEASDLGFGVSSGVSEEGSAEYGDLVGADSGVTRLLAKAPREVSADTITRVAEQWEPLRLGVFAWVNAEATRGDSPLRLTLADSGVVRASTLTNIEMPAAYAGMQAVELRRAVRRDADAFKDGLLRTEAASAAAEASRANAAAARARMIASRVTLAAVAMSLAAAFAAAIWLYRTIAGPLDAARRVAARVTSGDYDAAFTKQADDEIGAVVHAVEEMRAVVVGQLSVMKEMAGAVILTAEGVRSGTTTLRVLLDDAEGDLEGALGQVDRDTSTLMTLAEQMLEA